MQLANRHVKPGLTPHSHYVLMPPDLPLRGLQENEKLVLRTEQGFALTKHTHTQTWEYIYGLHSHHSFNWRAPLEFFTFTFRGTWPKSHSHPNTEALLLNVWEEEWLDFRGVSVFLLCSRRQISANEIMLAALQLLNILKVQIWLGSWCFKSFLWHPCFSISSW